MKRGRQNHQEVPLKDCLGGPRHSPHQVEHQSQDPAIQPSLSRPDQDQSEVHIQKWIWEGVTPPSRNQVRKMMALAIMHGVRTVFQTRVYR